MATQAIKPANDAVLAESCDYNAIKCESEGWIVNVRSGDYQAPAGFKITKVWVYNSETCVIVKPKR